MERWSRHGHLPLRVAAGVARRRRTVRSGLRTRRSRQLTTRSVVIVNGRHSPATAAGAAHVVSQFRDRHWLRISGVGYVTRVTDRQFEILLECDPPTMTHEELTRVWHCH